MTTMMIDGLFVCLTVTINDFKMDSAQRSSSECKILLLKPNHSRVTFGMLLKTTHSHLDEILKALSTKAVSNLVRMLKACVIVI